MPKQTMPPGLKGRSSERYVEPLRPYQHPLFLREIDESRVNESMQRFGLALRTHEDAIRKMNLSGLADLTIALKDASVWYHTQRANEERLKRSAVSGQFVKVNKLADKLYALLEAKEPEKLTNMRKLAQANVTSQFAEELRVAEAMEDNRQTFRQYLAKSLAPTGLPASGDSGHDRLKHLEHNLSRLIEACTLERSIVYRSGPREDTLLPDLCSRLQAMIIDACRVRVPKSFEILDDGKFQNTLVELLFVIVNCVDVDVTRDRFLSAARIGLRARPKRG